MIVTLLTDFGTGDYFVAAMKGIILSGDPALPIVDLSHEIPAHDIEAAAYHLLAVHADFPDGTVHTIVVDPGVGSSRRPIAARGARHLFVAPDNGVLSYVLHREQEAQIRSIEHPLLRRSTVGSTFHGRDLFAPAAAALATGFDFAEVGPLVHDPVRLQPLVNRAESDGTITGRILHVDRFGNCVTSLRAGDLPGGPGRFVWQVGEVRVEEVREFYGAGPGGVPFVIEGSAGFLEISIDQESAAARLAISRGQTVRAVPGAS